MVHGHLRPAARLGVITLTIVLAGAACSAKNDTTSTGGGGGGGTGGGKKIALLREFATNPGHLLSHASLLRRVWGPGYATETEYTRVYVRRLRNKLEGPDGPALIVTEPRAGYRFVAAAAHPEIPEVADDGV